MPKPPIGPVIRKAAAALIRGASEVQPAMIWPCIREAGITITHAILDWGNKVTPEMREKRAESKAARHLRDAARVSLKNSPAGLPSSPAHDYFQGDEDQVESTEWRAYRPTRKQLAVLQYFGITEAPENRGQASDWIDGKFSESQANPTLRQKAEDWQFARMILYPDMYGDELRWFKSNLYEELRNRVRSRVVGASGKLTGAKIASVVDDLMREDPWWPKSPNKFGISFDRLKKSYPECCDGKSPPRRQSPGKDEQSKGSCLFVLLAWGTFATGLGVWIMNLK